MAIRTYTEDEFRELSNAQIRSNVTGADVSPYSDYDLWARVLAAIASGSQAHAAALGRQIFPKDCDESELEAHGASRGLGYLAPTKARGYLIVEGDAGDLVPSGSLFGGGGYVALADTVAGSGALTPVAAVEGSGRERLLVSDTSGMSVGMILAVGTQTTAVKAIPASGIVDLLLPLSVIPFVGDLVSGVAGALVPVEATATGARWNAPGGSVLAFDAVPVGTGFSDTGISASIAGGADAESASDYRGRIVDFEAGRAASTNVESVRTLARAFPDARIAEAFVYPNLGYPGHTYVVAYGAPGARELSTLATSALELFLLGGIGSEVDITVEPIAFDGTAADIDLTVLAGTGFEPDWGSSALSTFTTGPGSTTSRVELTTSPVGVITVGSRVLVPVVVGAMFRTEQRQVQAVDATGFDLTQDLSAEPASGVTITSGSAAAQRIIDSLTKYFETRGPGTYVASATKDRIRWPNPGTAGGAVVSEASLLAAAAVEGLITAEFTSGSFATRTPAALQTIRLGALIVRHVYA